MDEVRLIALAQKINNLRLAIQIARRLYLELSDDVLVFRPKAENN